MSLARRLGVTPLVVGLTVVAMGTSAPEVAASIAAAIRGIGDVSIGNVYGSNVANLALVGGLAAFLSPLRVRRSTIRREIPVMLGVGLLLWPALYDLELSRWDAIVLLFVFVCLIAGTVYLARRESQEIAETTTAGVRAERGGKGMALSVVYVAGGLAGLAVGADLAVRGAVYLGQRAGMSEAVIGLTIVAVGTSLPELATSVVASVRGEHDISIGNLVGSNIFNTLLVVGTAGTVRPFGIVGRLAGADYWIMMGISAGFVVLILAGRRRLTRISGGVLLLTYIAYIGYLLGVSG